jgi:hypothetical protein
MSILKNTNFVFLISWLLLIFILCIMPTDQLPKVSWNLLEPDKWVHATIFIIYGYLAIRAFSAPFQAHTRRTACYILLFAILYSIFLETYQHYGTANRCFELADIVSNTFGTMLALAVGVYKQAKQSEGQ